MRITDLIVTGVCRLLAEANIDHLVIRKLNEISEDELNSIKGVRQSIQNVLEDMGSEVSNMQQEQDNFKSKVSDAIKEKNPGATVSSSSNSQAFVSDISNIQTGSDVSGVTANAKDVLSGKTFVDKNGDELSGTMDDRTSKISGFCGYENITIQKHPSDPGNQALVTLENVYGVVGYYGNKAKVTGNLVCRESDIRYGAWVGRGPHSSPSRSNSIYGTFTSDANANAEHILSGVIAYTKGNKVTGNIPNRTNDTGTRGLSWSNTSYNPILAGSQLRIPINMGYYGNKADLHGWECPGIVISNIYDIFPNIASTYNAWATLFSPGSIGRNASVTVSASFDIKYAFAWNTSTGLDSGLWVHNMSNCSFNRSNYLELTVSGRNITLKNTHSSSGVFGIYAIGGNIA